LFTREELAAVVDEAQMAGVRVACHSTSLAGSREAVEAGVNSIEHGTELSRELVQDIARRGTWYVPTFTIFRFHRTTNPDPVAKRIAGELAETHTRSFQHAMEAGVRIAMGTDAGYAAGEIGMELGLMVGAGMSPLEAIEASTRRGAECMGIGDITGTLEIDKEADLLVVDGDISRDVGLLVGSDNLSLVMKAGKPMAGPMAQQFGWERKGWPVKWA
jgi:imidazolonepropionase-like amidohydrolase